MSVRFIHRLDYATSGCLCVALNKKAARWGNKAFAKRYVTKHYLALVCQTLMLQSVFAHLRCILVVKLSIILKFFKLKFSFSSAVLVLRTCDVYFSDCSMYLCLMKAANDKLG